MHRCCGKDSLDTGIFPDYFSSLPNAAYYKVFSGRIVITNLSLPISGDDCQVILLAGFAVRIFVYYDYGPVFSY